MKRIICIVYPQRRGLTSGSNAAAALPVVDYHVSYGLIAMNYSFNSKYAEMYGLQQSVVLQHIIWWVLRNGVYGRNFKDNRFWTYNSVKAFRHEFPFLSQKQIRKCLQDLKKDGAILVGSYNKMRADRTKWYTLSDALMLDVQRNPTYKSWLSKHLSSRAKQYHLENNNNNKETLREEQPYA